MSDLQQRRRRSAAEAEQEALQQLEMELQGQEVEPLPALNDETEIPDEEQDMQEKTNVGEKTTVETPRALPPKPWKRLCFPRPSWPPWKRARARRLTCTVDLRCFRGGRTGPRQRFRRCHGRSSWTRKG